MLPPFQFSTRKSQTVNPDLTDTSGPKECIRGSWYAILETGFLASHNRIAFCGRVVRLVTDSQLCHNGLIWMKPIQEQKHQQI